MAVGILRRPTAVGSLRPVAQRLWGSCGRTCLFFFDGRLCGGFGAELFGDGVGEDAADGDSGAHLALQ